MLNAIKRSTPIKIYGFKNQFNQFFISIRFSRLIFNRFFLFSLLIGFFNTPTIDKQLYIYNCWMIH